MTTHPLDQAIESSFRNLNAPAINTHRRAAVTLPESFFADLAAELPRTELAASDYVAPKTITVAPSIAQEASVQEPTFRGGPSYGIGAPKASRPSATPKQMDLINNLRSERQVPASWDHCFVQVADGTATWEQVRKLIDGLFKLPRKAVEATTPAAPKIEVPAGRYAVDGEDGETKFYVVDRPTEGRWNGYTFVNVQASDDLFPVRGQAAQVILAKIAVDPQAATIRYGHELGVCGRCGRTLTDEASRAAGIGPVCAGKLGM